MFYNCKNLITPPALSANNLAISCYSYMFYGCTSLTTAPTLPATSLRDSCYNSMFRGCTSLTTAPTLPATSLASYCYQYMFYGCTNLTTPPELPATTLTSGCYGYMFQNCTSLTTAPVLLATTLVDSCYYYMFYGCTSLNYVKCLGKTYITSSSNLYNWLSGVSATGTFIKDPEANDWTTGYYGIPSGWTVLVDTSDGLRITSDSKYGENNKVRFNKNENSLSMTFYLRSDYTYQINSPAWITGVITKDTSKSYENQLDYLTLSLTASENTSGSDRTGNVSVIIYDENNNQFTKSIVFNVKQYSIEQYVNVDLNNLYVNDGTDGSSTIYKLTLDRLPNTSGTFLMYININGYSSFTIQLKNYFESSYSNYPIVGFLDKVPNLNNSNNTKWNGRGYSSETSWNTITFNDIPAGEHYISIMYNKSTYYSGETLPAYFANYGVWIKIPDVTDEQ
jgi:hypothetical protein